ncbi:MAG: ATPase, T2SS/T4P/T4SS family [Actinomycetota bacterium]
MSDDRFDAVVDDVHRSVAAALVVRPEREAEVRRRLADHLPLATRDVLDRLAAAVMARLEGLGPLEPLVRMPGVSDVLVNGPGPVWIERDGQLTPTEVVVDVTAIEAVIQRAVAPLGRRVDRASPTVDARLPGGVRLHAVLPPLAVDGPYVSIRLPSVERVGLEPFTSERGVSVLRRLVDERANVLVAGATGAGKTTLLGAMLDLVDRSERVVIVEEAAEIAAPERHVVRLETRAANAEGIGAADLARLVRETLRMRPDRLVLGEVRGPEAFDLVQALSTGHRGSLATIHAADAGDALRRLETLALTAGHGVPHGALRRLVAAAVDAVCVVERTSAGRRLAAVVRPAADGDPDRAEVLHVGDAP